MSKAYDTYRKQLDAEQKNMSPEEVKRLMSNRAEWLLELDNMPKQQHVWVDRGLVLSCEGGDHPNHRVFKRR